MIRGSGVFGSVREALELGASLVRKGHDFTFYTSELDGPRWLPASRTLTYRHTVHVVDDELDIVVFSDDMRNIGDLVAARCPRKVVCIMGFDPLNVDTTFGGDLGRVLSPYPIIADSPWQVKILSKFFTTGPAIGGVNTDLFKPVNVDNEKTCDVVWSGDVRGRKGGDTVLKAIEGMNAGTYFKKGIRQEGMSAFLCSGKVFVDGHLRGGWCNPVIEAMSCGLPVVCTDTPCNSDFAIHEHNCLKVPMNDHIAMREAIDGLLADPAMCKIMGDNGRKTALQWTHDAAADRFIKWAEHGR